MYERCVLLTNVKKNELKLDISSSDVGIKSEDTYFEACYVYSEDRKIEASAQQYKEFNKKDNKIFHLNVKEEKKLKDNYIKLDININAKLEQGNVNTQCIKQLNTRKKTDNNPQENPMNNCKANYIHKLNTS